MVLAAQSIFGLVFFNQGLPRMMFSFPQCKTWRVSSVVMPSICRYMVQVYQMGLVLLADLSIC